ncbi:transposase, partial [Bacillus thuringiensis]
RNSIRVQEITLEENKKYMLIGGKVRSIIPVVKYLKYLDNTGKSSNTQKTYYYALKQYFIYLR